MNLLKKLKRETGIRPRSKKFFLLFGLFLVGTLFITTSKCYFQRNVVPIYSTRLCFSIADIVVHIDFNLKGRAGEYALCTYTQVNHSFFETAMLYQ